MALGPSAHAASVVSAGSDVSRRSGCALRTQRSHWRVAQTLRAVVQQLGDPLLPLAAGTPRAAAARGACRGAPRSPSPAPSRAPPSASSRSRSSVAASTGWVRTTSAIRAPAGTSRIPLRSIASPSDGRRSARRQAGLDARAHPAASSRATGASTTASIGPRGSSSHGRAPRTSMRTSLREGPRPASAVRRGRAATRPSLW